MKDTKTLGDLGETIAARYLKRHFYRICARNVSAPHGEIDIVACKADTLVFVEVKTRTAGRQYQTAAAAVDSAKQKHLLSAARHYLLSHPTKRKIRFDVIEIYVTQQERDRLLSKKRIGFSRIGKVHHIINAFSS